MRHLAYRCSKWFDGLQFKSKVIAIFLPLLLLSLLTLALLSSNLFSRSVIERTNINIRSESKLILAKLDSIIGNAEISANLMVTNLNRLIKEYPAERSSLEEARFRNLMQSRLSTDLSLFPEVEAAVFVDQSGNIYPSYTVNNDERQVFDSGMIERLRDSGSYGVTTWFPMERRDYLAADPDEPVLTLGKMVVDIDSGTLYGTLFLTIKESTLSSFFTQNVGSAETMYYLVDSGQRVIASPDKHQLLHTFEQPGESGESGRLMVTASDYESMDWKLIHIESVDALTADIHNNIRLTAFIGLICLVLALIGASVLSKRIVYPLQQLTGAMKQVVAGNLSVTAPVHTRDEVGVIAKAFNTMLQRIQELLATVEREQAQKREFELALISAQIKPHFLYNTLDTIYILNDLERNEEARDTTKALADFYRIVLSKGRELIILEQETKLVSDYLAIMQVRYPDVFRYEIDIPPLMHGLPVPKLSLQPLVENAIYHGLKTKGMRGLIRISAFVDGKKAVIRVEDDGVGMSKEQVERLMNFHTGSAGTESIGIYSVQERLKLYFGEPYGVFIRSAPGEGTVAKMIVPAVATGGENHV
ncbi:cache domain-containing sensor histidine kinase [Paenibacillus abyssi]|uniref:Histidine kinase n=1 Tax=Paenibacillus abyssi TaxID=1340531 RepID=A0A917D414_9BACL|nr:sensor histidine kinase [Paenibacillus abyssi]GGG07969.1 histidine kinase [Paenibacillus abyssi]